MEEPFDPASLDENAFLAGPERYDDWDGEGELLSIAPIFGKPFDRLLSEVEQDARLHGGPSATPDPDAPDSPSETVPGYAFREVEAGVLLVDPDGVVVGGYLGCDVSIAEGHQGKGLGAELILEYAMRNGRIPVWDHDEAAYSPAGEKAHRAAHALARDRGFFERKRATLADRSPPSGMSL